MTQEFNHGIYPQTPQLVSFIAANQRSESARIDDAARYFGWDPKLTLMEAERLRRENVLEKWSSGNSFLVREQDYRIGPQAPDTHRM